VLNRGLSWLEQKLKAFCSSPVEYRRNSQTLEVNAVFSKSDYQTDTGSGISVESFVWDFLIEAADLGTEPQVGDTVIVNGRSFEVMKLAGQGCWRWTGPNQRTYRIHTRDIGDDL